MPITCGDIPRLICSVIIPPVGVFFQVGCTKDLAINCLLTVLGYGSSVLFIALDFTVTYLCDLYRYIPGVIHAVYILIKE